jgi:glycosyltransferase involved in cell wall biosynthesis
VRLYGLTMVWNEADVVWATIRNLFVQGADEVFVIDDESTDGTREEARAAGATVIEQRSNGVFLESERTSRIRAFIEAEMACTNDAVWWLVADADEFPRGPDGGTVRELVESLPAWVDIVGARVLEHVPGGSSSYRRRTHPASTIPLARWYWNPYCPQGHWKHPLFRVCEVNDVFPLRGRHTVGAADGRRLREAGPSLLTHHVPLRDRARTEAKLAAARERYLPVGVLHSRFKLERRIRIAADQYEGRYDVCENEFPGQRRRGIEVEPWECLVPACEGTLPDLGSVGSAR